MTKIGTPFYMAPEILNHETYDFKCDVWSLGIIFYEMCELKHPFGEKGTVDCFDLSLPFKVPVIDTKKRRFHPAMNKICEMMIVREPEKRVDLHQIVNHHLIRNKFCTVFFEKWKCLSTLCISIYLLMRVYYSIVYVCVLHFLI